MEYFPVEVISHILGFLPSLEDRKASSLVCKLWYEAYQNPAFRTREVVEITRGEIFNDLSQLKNPNRKFFHVAVDGVDITDESMDFWRRFGPHLRSLSITKCDVGEKTLVNLIGLCPQLEALRMNDCRELLICGRLFESERDRGILRERLSHLKGINLGYNRYLSDAIFVKFASLCTNVEDLSLPGCHISFHSCLYRRFYPKNGSSAPSESVLTFPVIFDFIQSHAKKLKRLSFNETLIDSNAISSISQTRDLSLVSLHLRKCPQLTNEGILKLSNFQTSLTHLDLALCPRVTDSSVLTICSLLTKLESLSIQGCRAVTDLGVSHLCRLTKLKRLNISECELVRDEGIVRGLCTGENSSHLEELYLSYLGDLSDNAIVTVSDCLPNLKVLDLGYCYNAVTDRSVQSIFTKAKSLRSLALTMCMGLTDRGLTGIALEPSPVSEPEMEKPLRIPLGSKAEVAIVREAKTKQDVREMIEKVDATSDDSPGSSLGNLKHLQSLNLFGCNRISDISLRYAFKLCDLRSLDLSHCPEVTSGGLATVADANKCIETLKLDGCHSITDDGVGYILRCLKRLRTLVLGSPRVTDGIAGALLEEGRALIFLDVRNCPRIGASAIASIRDQLPHLQLLHPSDCQTA